MTYRMYDWLNPMYHYEFIDDLIPLILDADKHWWPCHLAALARVSHGWLYYARKRLYGCPDIRTFIALEKLADTLKANKKLATLVRGISLEPVLTESMIYTGEQLWKAKWLLGLKELRKITIGGNILEADTCVRDIRYAEEVEEMHIKGWSHRLMNWNPKDLIRFSRLKKMRFSKVILGVSWVSIEYPNASFTELILEDVSMIHGGLVNLLNGKRWLRCLHVTAGSCSEDELKEVLGSCTVECLHYEVRKTNGRWNPFSDLSVESGRKVRCLHLKGHLMDVGILDTLRKVFWNLEELVVDGRSVRVQASEWVELVSSRALSSLRRLGLPSGMNSPPFSTWNEEEMEDIRGVVLERGKVVI